MNQILFNKNTWRLLVIDRSGIYSQIHDELYGNNQETLTELMRVYSDKKKYQCILLEA